MTLHRLTASSPVAPPTGKIKATHKGKAGHLFISATTHRRIPIFCHRHACEIFFENLEFYRRKYGFYLHAYALMPDHFHLLIYFPADTSLVSFLRGFKSTVGMQIVDWLKQKASSPAAPAAEIVSSNTLLSRLAVHRPRRRRKDPSYAVWQRDSYITPLLSSKIIRQKLNYIHDNPRREKLVANPEDYLWSSAALYAGRGNSAVQVDLLELPYD